MGEIKIVKSAINNEGQKLCEDSEKIMEIKRRLELLLDNLSLAWVGEDSKSFINALKINYIPNLEVLGLKIEAYGKYLQGVKKPYEHLDSSYGRKKIGK